MDFANERYVRLYTRETTTHRLLTWQAQALLPQVLKMVDRSGVLELGEVPAAEAILAHLPKWPLEVIEAGMASLLERHVIQVQGDRLVWPKYLDGQETPISDAQRQRESREKRRVKSMSPVTPRHGSRDTPIDSDEVIDSTGSVSRDVTPRHSSRSDPAYPADPADPRSPLTPLAGGSPRGQKPEPKPKREQSVAGFAARFKPRKEDPDA